MQPPPGFPGGARGKESACQCRKRKRWGFDSWVWKIPWRRKWQPVPLFLPGKFHRQRSLAGYSPRVTESDTTERAHTHTQPPYVPAMRYSHLSPRNEHSCSYKNLYMFVAASFTIGQTGNDTDVLQQVNLVHSDKEILSALNRNELVRHEKTWRKRECILLRERSQPGKATVRFQL